MPQTDRRLKYENDLQYDSISLGVPPGDSTHGLPNATGFE